MTLHRPAVVLCVAAEPLSLSVRGLVLQSEGYTVVPASTFEQAIHLAAERRPDLIVCDQAFGKSSGMELAKSLKELDSSTPILLIKGVVDPIPQTLAVDAYMTKIDGPEAFLRNVAALLKRSTSDSHAA